MRKDEQIDALMFALENLIDEAINKIDNEEDAIPALLSNIIRHVNHHLEEFDINLYEVIGVIEDIKYTMLIEGEIQPVIIGCLDAQKIALLTQDTVSFECEFDDEDEL